MFLFYLIIHSLFCFLALHFVLQGWHTSLKMFFLPWHDDPSPCRQSDCCMLVMCPVYIYRQLPVKRTWWVWLHPLLNSQPTIYVCWPTRNRAYLLTFQGRKTRSSIIPVLFQFSFSYRTEHSNSDHYLSFCINITQHKYIWTIKWVIFMNKRLC